MKRARRGVSGAEGQAGSEGEHPTSNIQHPTSNIEPPTSKGVSRGGPDRLGEKQTEKESAKKEPAELSGDEMLMVGAFQDAGTTRRAFNLEERLLSFASAVIDLSEQLPDSRAGNHVAGQILRAGTSAYPNHGEAEEAESRNDFIHKMKLCLKELRETRRWARLIRKQGWARNGTALAFVLAETDELIRIFYASVQTARRNALQARQVAPVPPPPARGTAR